jgi:hypothetical protein
MGIGQDNAAGRRRFAEAMEARRGKDEPVEWKLVTRGWFLGGAVLRGRLLEMMEGGMGGHHSGEEKRETDGRKAERIVQEELEKRGWTEEDLAARRKTDADKTAIAARLRRQTVMTLDWIAKRLKMGCRHTAANCLKRITNSRDPYTEALNSTLLGT